MNTLGIATCVIAAVNIFIGILVFIKNPKRIANVTYLLVNFAISLWSISIFFYNNPTHFDTNTWLKIVYGSSYFMLFSQMVFVYFFPKKLKDNFFVYSLLIFVALLPSAYVLFFKENVILSTEYISEEFKTVAKMGPGYIVYTIPNLLGIVFLSIYFLRKGAKFVGYEKVQIKFYVLGSLLMFIPVVILDYIVPLFFNNTDLYRYSPLFVVPFTVLVAYSILQNRFLDQKEILVQGVITLLKTAFLLFYLYAFYYIAEKYLLGIVGDSTFLIFFILTLFVVYLYSRYSNLVENLVKGILLRKTNTLDDLVNDFSKKNSGELNINKICINIRETVVKATNVSKLSVYLFDNKKTRILFRYLYNIDLEGLQNLLEILDYWRSIGDQPMLISDELKRRAIFEKKNINEKIDKILDFMDQYKISAIFPLSNSNQISGVLLVGYKPQEIPFTVEEVKFLENIITNTSVAVGRSLLYKQVQDFNDTLKQKVNEQTKELQIKIKELEEARRKEADMIDIMGHELRTPATIVKLNAELLHSIIEKRSLTDLSKYVERIKDGVEREIKLINTLLSSAKLEGDKIELNPEQVDIDKEIDMSVHAYEKEANAKGLQLINNVPNDVPPIYGDHARVVEIVNNLISNAVKYTDKGSVTITHESDENFVKINIADTGRGIPQEDIAKLGTKFYRVKTYIENGEQHDGVDIVRPGGTGLGLYVVFNLVKKMGGQIHIQSELGKGSIFSFSLPKYINQDQKSCTVKSNNMFERLKLREKAEKVQE